MTAVRNASDRIPCERIIVSGRPMLTAVRARILRDEFDDVSLKRSLLIADAVGVDLVDPIVLQGPKPERPVRKPVAKTVLQPIVARKTSKVRKAMPVGPDLFEFFSVAAA